LLRPFQKAMKTKIQIRLEIQKKKVPLLPMAEVL
jgi:hypothetical protein